MVEAMSTAAGRLYPHGERCPRRVRPEGGPCGRFRRRGETFVRIFGHRANGGRRAAAETAGATRPWRIHAETFVCGPGARTERCARAARTRRCPGGHLRCCGQGTAR